MSEPSNERWQRAKSLFHEAVERPADEREAFLRKACGDDLDLFGQVQSLLAQHETADGQPTTQLTVPLTEKPGTRIGPYKLLQRIGEGGFGSVFLADQERPVRRRVALKIIKLGMDTRQVIARFEAERQALAMMDHPNIARVLDGGTTDSGRPYFVMEYVIGDVITRFADAHRLGVPERLTLFSQVCQAVQHAHTKGIIHRDLKPANVLVSMTDGRPFAKVIDFGIAKATSGGAVRLTDKTLFTEHQQLIGTPEYMSPEQAQGSPDIDTRTDVYALGVLLYELLTGLTPFDAKRLRSAAWAEMQRIIREEDPPAPSMRLTRNLETLAATAAARKAEPDKLSGLIKGELDWIVMKSLDKDRGRRYESASQFAADVERHLAGEAVVAAPPRAAYRLRKFVRRHRGAVVSAGAVTLALLFGIGGTIWQGNAARRANAAMRQQWQIAESALNQIVGEGTGGDMTIRSVPQPGTNDHEHAVRTIGNVALGQMRLAKQRQEQLEQTNAELREQAERTTRALESVFEHVLQQPAGSEFDGDMLGELRQTLGVRLEFLDDNGKGQAWVKVTDAHGKPLSGKLAVSALTEYAKGYFDRALDALRESRARAEALEVANARLRGHADAAQQGVGRMLSILTQGETSGSVHSVNESGGSASENDPLGYVVEFGVQLAESLRDERDNLALEAYVANLALAQAAMESQNWPEARRRLAACPESQRGWEWKYLNLRAKSIVAAIPEAAYATFSPDGSLILASSDSSAQLWDVQGRLVGTTSLSSFRHNAAPVFSSDGTRVLTAKGQDVAQVWNLNGKPVSEPMRHGPYLTSAILSSNNANVLTVATDGMARVWNGMGQQIGEPFGQGVNKAIFNPSGTLVVTEESHGTARLWDAAGQPIGQPMHPDGFVKDVMFSPDGALVLTISDDGMARLWDAMGRPVGEPMRHESAVWGATFSPDGGLLLTHAAHDNRVFLWDTTGRSVGRPMVHGTRVGWVAFSRDGTRVLTASDDGFVRQWDRFGRPVADPMRHNHGGGVAFWSSRTHVITASLGPTVRLWDLDGRNVGEVFMGGMADTSYPSIADWSPDGRFAILNAPMENSDGLAFIVDTTQFDGVERVLETQGGRAAQPALEVELLLAGSTAYVALAPAATVRLTGGGTFEVCWTDAGRHPLRLSTQGGKLAASAISPDGRRVVTASTDRAVRFWKTDQGREMAMMPLPAAAKKLDFTPDGGQLVITLANDNVLVWDTRPAEARQADRDRRAADRKLAEPFVDGLLSGAAATDEIESSIREDRSLTPLRRLTALDVLRERVAALEFQAERAFERISDGQTDKAVVEAMAENADLPPRVKSLVVAKAAEWEYEPAVSSPEDRLTDETRNRRLAEAAVAVRTVDSGRGREASIDECHAVRRALDTRIELLGIDHADVADAAIVLRAQCGNDDMPEYELIARAAARLQRPDAEWRDKDFWLAWVAADLATHARDYDSAVYWYRLFGSRLLDYKPVSLNGPWPGVAWGLYKTLPRTEFAWADDSFAWALEKVDVATVRGLASNRGIWVAFGAPSAERQEHIAAEHYGAGRYDEALAAAGDAANRYRGNGMAPRLPCLAVRAMALAHLGSVGEAGEAFVRFRSRLDSADVPAQYESLITEAKSLAAEVLSAPLPTVPLETKGP